MSEIKEICMARINPGAKCSMHDCKKEARWGFHKRIEDKKIILRYSCDEHTVSNFAIIKR